MTLTRRHLLQAAVASSVIPSARAETAARRVVIVRYGGGVRRREVLHPQHSFSPWLLRSLVPRGTLFPQMEIERLEGVETSHAQGTIYLMTGRYERLEDISGQILGDAFEPGAPTLFEVVRRAAGLPLHEALVINNENRMQDEYLGWSTDPDHGFPLRAGVLSRTRWRVWHGRRRLDQDGEDEAVREELKKLEARDFRGRGLVSQGPRFDRFWEGWRRRYGDSGRTQPRGDRLLTELAIQAMEQLSPRLMLVNYSDCDYVHWGDPQYYTRAVSIMDDGVRRIVEATDRIDGYAGRTLVVVVPDCGRDSNPFLSVPYQHHFGDKSSHEIFALFLGPGIAQGRRVDRLVQQVDVAPTVAAWLGMSMASAEGSVLGEVGT